MQPGSGGVRYDTTEAYLGVTHGGFSAKWSLALTPYFGLRDSTAATAFAEALPGSGSSRGSSYLDLNYQHPLGDWAVLGLHAGHTQVRNYSELSYADWRVSLARSWGPWTATLAWAGTSAVPRTSAGRLQRARNTPITITKEIATGGMPSVTSLVGASAAPSQAPAVTPDSTPSACSRERRAASTPATGAARRPRRRRRAGSRTASQPAIRVDR